MNNRRTHQKELLAVLVVILTALILLIATDGKRARATTCEPITLIVSDSVTWGLHPVPDLLLSSYNLAPGCEYTLGDLIAPNEEHPSVNVGNNVMAISGGNISTAFDVEREGVSSTPFTPTIIVADSIDFLLEFGVQTGERGKNKGRDVYRWSAGVSVTLEPIIAAPTTSTTTPTPTTAPPDTIPTTTAPPDTAPSTTAAPQPTTTTTTAPDVDKPEPTPTTTECSGLICGPATVTDYPPRPDTDPGPITPTPTSSPTTPTPTFDQLPATGPVATLATLALATLMIVAGVGLVRQFPK